MDGFSAAASVVTMVEISVKIFGACQTYFSAVKEARKDIQRLREGVLSLQDVLTEVRDLTEHPNAADKSVLGLFNQNNGSIQRCEKVLRDLELRLDDGGDQNKMKQFGLRAMRWPFSSKEIDKILEDIHQQKVTFTLALGSAHL
jgi:hypothetical protein